MRIDGLGERIIELLVKAGHVNSFSDIYRLNMNTLLSIERMGKKSAEKLLQSIENSKTPTLRHFLHAISINGIGEGGSRRLAETFGTLDALMAADKQTLMAIHDVGDIESDNVIEYFAQDSNRRLIQDLIDLGVSPELPMETGTALKLADHVYVVTGTLDKYKRSEVEEALRALGATVSSSVSKKVTALIAGAKAGSKLAKAEKLGIPVLAEDALDSLLSTD